MTSFSKENFVALATDERLELIGGKDLQEKIRRSLPNVPEGTEFAIFSSGTIALPVAISNENAIHTLEYSPKTRRTYWEAN